MDGVFSFLGKLALVLIIAAVLLGVGYYVGTGKLPFPISPIPQAVSTTAPPPTPTTTNESPLSPTTAATLSGVTVPPSPTNAPAQVVSGGGPKGATFSPYTVNVPASWTVTRNETPNTFYKLTISQGDYAMNITQAAMGTNPCVYSGDPPQAMSISFGPFVALKDSFGNSYRRATPTGSTSGFTVCQQGPAYFNTSTMYGLVTYTTPVNPDPSMLSQMDAIFATLKD